MTKDEIKGAPDLDEARHRDDESGYHEEVGSYYDARRSQDGVLVARDTRSA